MDYTELLKELEEQEENLQFTSFTNELAVSIGMELYRIGREKNLPIAIDIMRNGQQLFHAALPGTTPDNDQWIIRKCRVVNRFHQSSYHMGIQLKSENRTLEDKYYLSESEYAVHGGCFPVIIKNVGVVGTITVSGLPQAEDHALVVSVIRKFIN